MQLERRRRSRRRCSTPPRTQQLVEVTSMSLDPCPIRFSPDTSVRAATTSRDMLAAVGAPSLDALIDESDPAGHPPARRRSTCRRPRASSSTCARLRDDRRAEPASAAVYIGLGYYDTHHADRHPAQRAREPGLVHAVHAVPGRDRAGPPRIAAQLPDDGERPDGDGGRQRVAAGRGDGGGRGDDAAAARAARRRRRARRAFLVSDRVLPADASTCCAARAEPLGIDAARSAIRRADVRRPTCSACCVQYAGRPRRGRATCAPLIERAHAAGVLRRGRRPICWR